MPRVGLVSLQTIRNRLKITIRHCERATIRKSHEQFLTEFKSKPKNAEQYLSVGTIPIPEKADHAELAAWTLVASQILNLDETVTR